MTKHTESRAHVEQSCNTLKNKVNLANIVRKKKEVSLNWKLFKSNLDDQKKDKTSKPLAQERQARPKPVNVPPRFSVVKPFGIVSKQSESQVDIAVPSKFSGSPRITRHVAMDCEMVGVDDNGKESILARVSLVNKFGDCIYDKFVKPRETVTDYRTKYSGVRPRDLKDAEEFEVVQKEVAEILKGRILVGHALSNDFKVLFLSHPRKRIRDTSKFLPFRKLNNNRTPSLRKLASIVLGVTIQQGEHNSIIDANTSMQLYMLYRKDWEKELHMKKVTRISKQGKKG
ncbi:RNA exonuclease 4 [Bacillus rossius redtenbacheri]|uniref:RNA exonuclease 4 n=1 Tax=Bacillus rossius redtenbacheri TaxID=93214 RepID=UPI002FDE8204